MDTREKLIVTAADLFRQKGFHGVGVAEILVAAGVPKGSLYHHFPQGKHDLAVAAARWASDGMLQIIDDSFRDADDFADGATTLCHKLAKFFDISGGWDGCPVSSILVDGPENDLFRSTVAGAFDAWIANAEEHGQRLGLSKPVARAQAELLLVGIQGAWTLARAKRNSEPLRRLPIQIYPTKTLN